MSLQETFFGALILLPAYFTPSRATNWYKFPVTLIVTLNALFLFASWFICSILKFFILRTSKTRQKTIRESVARDQEAFEAEKRSSPKSEDGDWEKVQATEKQSEHYVSSAYNDYDGFIGFFHPFASVISL